MSLETPSLLFITRLTLDSEVRDVMNVYLTSMQHKHSLIMNLLDLFLKNYDQDTVQSLHCINKEVRDAEFTISD